MAAAVGLEGSVTAVEPHSGTAVALRGNIALDGFSWVDAHEMAAGEEVGRVVLWSGTADNPTMMTRGTERVSVRAARIDGLPRPAPRGRLLKIDVEGFELPALRGADAVQPRADAIRFECNSTRTDPFGYRPADLRGFLGVRGFRAHRRGGDLHRPVEGIEDGEHLDLLAVRDGRGFPWGDGAQSRLFRAPCPRHSGVESDHWEAAMLRHVLIIGLAGALVLAGTVPTRADRPAKSYFGAVDGPAAGPAAAYGSYAKGCVAGAVELPETGPGWQAMRLSRNRNWGHPDAIAYIERLAGRAKALGWPRLYIGDISQPRGGPMLSGHRSHQMGVDIDIWFRPGAENPISRAERETIGSASVVAGDRRSMSRAWTPAHARVLRAAAEDGAVARIFVNAAIKAELCRVAEGDRAWLRKIRPWWGHDSHFHVRLACPAGSPACQNQDPPPPGDGCDDTLAWWFSDEALNPKPSPTPKPSRGALTLADLPPACSALVGQ